MHMINQYVSMNKVIVGYNQKIIMNLKPRFMYINHYIVDRFR